MQEGRILYFGGDIGAGGAVDDDVHLFEPATCAFVCKRIAHKPSVRR